MKVENLIYYAYFYLFFCVYYLLSNLLWFTITFEDYSHNEGLSGLDHLTIHVYIWPKFQVVFHFVLKVSKAEIRN